MIVVFPDHTHLLFLSNDGAKMPLWYFQYSALDDESMTSVRCLGCNAKVTAKVLRMKSHSEKCTELIKTKNNQNLLKDLMNRFRQVFLQYIEHIKI